ncbi:YciI family protein [Variovorax sp. DT-64]|uniref:YciI family protein n=1 Tax=Variovorax sp. DT-64 TaxID=3396160 RepID=UPI003F1A16EA
MRYLCMIFATDAQMGTIPPAEMAAFVNEHLDYDDRLRAGGHLVASEGLEAASTAAVVRVRNGRLSVTDGPFIETNEQLGGFYLVEAASEEEAVRLAAGIPSARVGSIELRPVFELARPAQEGQGQP